MYFPLPVASDSFTINSIGMAGYKNGEVAVEILSLSCIAADILPGSSLPTPLARCVCKIGLATLRLKFAVHTLLS